MEIRKLVQIVQHVLAKHNYRCNYTWLIKILYLADRAGFERWDASVTEDAYVSMDQGPVLSGLYDLIKGKYHGARDQALWDSRFRRDGYDIVSMVKEPVQLDELSEREIALLNEIEAQYHDRPWEQMKDLLHDRERFPEWTPPEGTSLPLHVGDILRALGRSDEDIKATLAEIQFFQTEAAKYPPS